MEVWFRDIQSLTKITKLVWHQHLNLNLCFLENEVLKDPE